jgi:hypothetical protein
LYFPSLFIPFFSLYYCFFLPSFLFFPFLLTWFLLNPSFFTYFLSVSSSFLNFLSFFLVIYFFISSVLLRVMFLCLFLFCFYFLSIFIYFFFVQSFLLALSISPFLLHPPVSSLSYILTGGRKAASLLLLQCDSLLFRERSMEALYSSASSSFHKAVKSRFAEIHNVLGMPSTPQCCYTLHK